MIYDIENGLLQNVAVFDTGIFNQQFVFSGTAGIQVPAGTTAQESITVNGTLRYNTELNALRARVNNAWASLVMSPVSVSNGGTNLTTLGAGNTVLGVNAGASGLEYKTLVAGAGVTITHGASSITLSSSALVSSEMPMLQVRRAATTGVTATFANIVWDTQDEENNSSVIEWVSGADITVKETGSYLIAYTIANNNTNGHTLNMRVRRNATTIIPGSEAQYFDTGVIDIPCNTFVATLTASDTLQLQIALATGTFTGMAGIKMSVIRLRGVKGDQGPIGATGVGSNVNVSNSGTPLAGGPFSNLNMVSNLIASNAGGGQTNISVVPSGSDTQIQFNNAGVLGASANYVWDNINSINTISGAVLQNRLTLYCGAGSVNTVQRADAALYIQVDGDDTFEGIRTYFNRSSPGIGGWISYHYDQNTPNIRITDEDDDPPYVSFRTIGSGTYDAPQFESSIGGRGPIAGRTTGLSFWLGNANSGTEIMAVDSNFLRLPTYTTAARPTPVNGMIGYNSTLDQIECYTKNAWQQWNSIGQILTFQVAQSSSGVIIPYDNTPPLVTEGSQAWSGSITPISASSRIRLTAAVIVSSSVASRHATLAIFRGNTLIGVYAAWIITASSAQTIAVEVVDTPNTTSAVTYSFRLGLNSTGNVFIAQGGTANFGGSANTNNNVTVMELL